MCVHLPASAADAPPQSTALALVFLSSSPSMRLHCQCSPSQMHAHVQSCNQLVTQPCLCKPPTRYAACTERSCMWQGQEAGQRLPAAGTHSSSSDPVAATSGCGQAGHHSRLCGHRHAANAAELSPAHSASRLQTPPCFSQHRARCAGSSLRSSGMSLLSLTMGA